MAKRKKATTKAKGKKKKAKSKKKAKTAESLIVNSKVRARIKKNGCLTSGAFLPTLNEQIYWLVDQACSRAQSNRRSTVKPQDV